MILQKVVLKKLEEVVQQDKAMAKEFFDDKFLSEEEEKNKKKILCYDPFLIKKKYGILCDENSKNQIVKKFKKERNPSDDKT